MNFSRIANCIDVDRMQRSKVSLIGAGGAAGLAENLVRCGLGSLDLFDFDVISEENLSRQAHAAVAMGKPKTEALADEVHRINPAVAVCCFNRDVTTMSDDELRDTFGNTDLLIVATDNFRAQAFGNKIALMLSKPAVWIGLYANGAGGEIVFWDRDIIPCYRCLLEKRYAAQEKAAADGKSLDPASDGCTIFDVSHLDAIGGDVCVGLLTRGADNRLGCLIDQLKGRNFIQVQFDPSWTLNGRNPIREKLGIAADNPAFFSWNAMALRDPDQGRKYCPDCEKYRGHNFVCLCGCSTRVGDDGIPVDQLTLSNPVRKSCGLN